MAPEHKLRLQFILLLKALDIAESLTKLTPVDWNLSLGKHGKGMTITRRSHSWKQLRLCCYDLRVLFIPPDELYRGKLTGILGPTRKLGNKRMRDVGLAMMKNMAPAEKEQTSLRKKINVTSVSPDGSLTAQSRDGYTHSPADLATAYLYGRWAHSTSTSDFYQMSKAFGPDADFEALSRFAFFAGHGFLCVVCAFCQELFGEEARMIPPGNETIIGLVAARKTFRRALTIVKARLAKVASTPKSVHELSF